MLLFFNGQDLCGDLHVQIMLTLCFANQMAPQLFVPARSQTHTGVNVAEVGKEVTEEPSFPAVRGAQAGQFVTSARLPG